MGAEIRLELQEDVSGCSDDSSGTRAGERYVRRDRVKSCAVGLRRRSEIVMRRLGFARSEEKGVAEPMMRRWLTCAHS